MQKAAIPENDVERVKAILDYEILDTLPEKEYDEIIALASFICNAPISLITFVDETRQVFKSSFGIDATYNEREYGFCAHGINTKDNVFIVQDTFNDHRFNDHPMVLGEPNIRFYAGVPLINPNGFVLGTLCVIDKNPRVLNKEQINALSILSKQVIQLLELRKTNAELVKAQQKANEYASQIKDFTYMASHDLKEPVRMTNLFLNKLKLKYDNLLDEAGNQYLKFALDGGERMSKLIDEILIFSKIEYDDFTKEEVNLKDVIDDVCALHFDNKNENKILIEYNNVSKINTSSTALKIILRNLISNAIKYQHQNIQPTIKITVSEEKNKWHFIITDNGIGIEEEYFETIFKNFKRLHTNSEYSGTGLGLSMAKKIINNLGGDIWVNSTVGKGSSFNFTIAK
jgi:signal transduction histidine kinase